MGVPIECLRRFEVATIHKQVCMSDVNHIM